MQRVISGCGGQFIDFPQNVQATSFSFDTFLLAGKRKVFSVEGQQAGLNVTKMGF